MKIIMFYTYLNESSSKAFQVHFEWTLAMYALNWGLVIILSQGGHLFL